MRGRTNIKRELINAIYTWNPVIRRSYFATRFFIGSLRRRRLLARSNKERRFRFIFGWERYSDLRWPEGQNLGEVLPEDIKLLLEGGPFFCRGELITLDTTWEQLGHHISVTRPLQIAARFLIEDGEGFSNAFERPPSVSDLKYFRYAEMYSFLGSSKLVSEAKQAGALSIESEILGRMLDQSGWDKVLNSLDESAVGWNDDQLADIHAGGHALITYQHLYFYLILEKYFRPRRPTKIIEIGGGFGGLARVVEKLAPDLVELYCVIDIPPVSTLQKYFLTQEFGDAVEVNGFGSRQHKFKLIDTLNLHVIPQGIHFDIAIATHSVTELDPEQICHYVDTVLAKASYVLLAMQTAFNKNRFDVTWVVERLRAQGFVQAHESVSDVYSWDEGRACRTFLLCRT